MRKFFVISLPRIANFYKVPSLAETSQFNQWKVGANIGYPFQSFVLQILFIVHSALQFFLDQEERWTSTSTVSFYFAL